MKTKEIIKRARDLAEPFRVSKGKNFRLKYVDPDDTLDFTKEADKSRAKEALTTGVAALAELRLVNVLVPVDAASRPEEHSHANINCLLSFPLWLAPHLLPPGLAHPGPSAAS